MKKRISDLNLSDLSREAGEAWSSAANRALEAGHVLGGKPQAAEQDSDAPEKKASKSGKTRVKAA